MGTIRIDFGSRGGSRAIKDLERFTDALQKAKDLSESISSEGGDVFAGLVSEAREASAVIRDLARDFQAVQQSAQGLGRIRLPRPTAPQAGGLPAGDGGATQQQAASLRELTEAQVRFNQVAQQSAERFQALRAAGVPLGDALDQIAQEFSLSEAEAKKLATQLTRLETAAQQVDEPVEEVQRSFSELAQEQIRAAQASQQVINTFQQLRRQGVSLEDSLNRLENSFDIGDGGDVQRLINELKRLETQSDRTLESGNNLTALGIAIKTQLVDIAVEALRSLGQTITGTLGAALNESADFSQASASAATLTNDVELLISELEKGQATLGGQVTTTELLAASYDVLSSGFTDAAEAAEITVQAQRAATAGFSDVGTSADALTTILNAYSSSGLTAAEITDQLVKTQDLGKITVDEYAQSIGRTASIAATAGVSFEELNAAIAAATVAGVQPESAVSGVRQAIVNLLRPTSREAIELLEDFGIANAAAALESRGLVGVLQDLSAQDISAEQLGIIFSDVDAFSAIAPIAGENIGRLNAAFEEIGNATGTAQKNIELLTASIPGLQTALQATVNEGLRVFGQALAPIQAAVLEFSGALLEATAQEFGGFDALIAAGERLNLALTENPELVEALGAAFASLADTAVEQLVQIIDAITALAGNQEAIDSLAQSIQGLGQFIVIVGEGVQFLIAFGEGLLNLNEGITIIEKVSVPFRILGAIIRTVSGAADQLAVTLERLGIIDPPDPVAFQSITTEIDAAKAAVEGYQAALAGVTADVPTPQGAANEVDAEAAAEAAAAREAEIQAQTQDELFAREQEFDRQKFAREQAFEQQLQSDKLAFESQLEARKQEIERGIEEQKRAFETQLEGQKRGFENELEAEKLAFERQIQNETRAFERSLQEEERRFNEEQQREKEAFEKGLQQQEQAVDRQVQLEFADNPKERRDLERQFAEEDARAARAEELRNQLGINEQKRQFEEQQRLEAEAFELEQEAKKLAFEDQITARKLDAEAQIENRKLLFEEQLQAQRIANEDALLARKQELLAPLDAQQAEFDAAQAQRKFDFQQQEQQRARDFENQQKAFEESYKADIRSADIAASETVADNLRQGAQDSKAILESTRIPAAQSGGTPQSGSVPSLRKGGTLQPFEMARVHKDEYIVPGQQGATVISQARSRAIQSAAIAKANQMAGQQQRLMAATLKEIQRLRNDINARPVPRMDVVQNYNTTNNGGGADDLMGLFGLIKL